MSDYTIQIKAGREKPVRQQHPWIFSGAIAEVRENPPPGEIVTVTDTKGRFLGRGYWNPRSQIQVRLLTWQDEVIDEAWWRRMLRRSIEARRVYNEQHRNNPLDEGWRVVNAENDFLPGLIVDRYGDWLVMQALTLHIDQHKAMIARILSELFAEIGLPVEGIYERSDVDVRHKEGLKEVSGLLWGVEPPERIVMGRNQFRYQVDVRNGHKTGFYLDQKPNHALVEALFQSEYGSDPNTSLLNLFSYTGRFGLAAPGRVVNVDASHEALEQAEQNYQRSGFDEGRVEFVQADVFDFLRDQAAQGGQYDVVVLDPPKFAHNAGQVEKAARGYKDINLNAFRWIRPGGHMLTFSCSGAISADLFQKIVFGALADSGRQAQILQHLGPGDDHPVALTFPEGAYLKGLLLRVY
ncbi:MAG: class I SAM-dependent rRNA methyltransferase [Anaerolineae bacterium]|nr:class I SAM-dependent rRNA methyltransferase [Anaerolineae bacterium]